MIETQIKNIHRAYQSLSAAWRDFQEVQPEQATIDTAIQRGYFLPEEDDFLWSLVSRYLTIRGGFWEIINEVSEYFSDDIKNIKSEQDWRLFLIAYAASCQVIGMARLLVASMAKHSLVQRKINEGSPQNRIPRKTFTEVFESLSDADNAIKMQYIMQFVDENRATIESLKNDAIVAGIVKDLDQLEQALHPSQLAFIKLRLSYLWHAIKRRFAVSKQQGSFFILEHAGRAIAEIGVHDNKCVTPKVLSQLESVLQAGDVIVTRHDFVASNLFLPGYWPHVALYIGSEGEKQQLGIKLDSTINQRWTDNIRTLEAKKDGVLFRPLNETLGVDELIVLRPDLSPAEIAQGLERACYHEGKSYNFDFDFFRSDQLVCTEVVYRAFDSLGAVKFELIERAGRFSLSAEDILDMAIQGKGFKVIAGFGFKGCEDQLVEGEAAHLLARASY